MSSALLTKEVPCDMLVFRSHACIYRLQAIWLINLTIKVFMETSPVTLYGAYSTIYIIVRLLTQTRFFRRTGLLAIIFVHMLLFF